MAELDPPATGCGEKLRRSVAVRGPARRLRIAIACALAAVPCAATSFSRPQPLFVWNASPSVASGLYVLFSPSGLQRGDMVVARVPGGVAALAAARRYLPVGVPLVKRVAAARGDRLCSEGRFVSINGRSAAVRSAFDARGRPLPFWQGCMRLAARQYFLLGVHPSSFDGRYFGPSSANDLIGKAVLLWRA